MNELPRDAWFYTREGERIGPVTLADLRVKAAECALNPRLDMVWTEGMAEWKPAGEIDGLFEKRGAAEPPEPLAPPAGSYAPPKHESVEETMNREGNWPGARRRGFLTATILFPMVWNVAFPIGAGFLTGPLGPEIVNYIVIGGVFLPVVVSIHFGLMRLVNLGMSRWWFFANFVPFLNFWLGYRTFACPAGYAYHKKLDGIGVFLAIVYWLMMLLVIVSIVAVIALLIGAVDNPEIRQQLQDAIRSARERIPQS
jgi:hypothetical protein